MRGALPEQICYHQRDDARVPDAAFRSVAALSLCPPTYAQWACSVARGNCSVGRTCGFDVATCCGPGLEKLAQAIRPMVLEKRQLRLDLFVWDAFMFQFASRMP